MKALFVVLVAVAALILLNLAAYGVGVESAWVHWSGRIFNFAAFVGILTWVAVRADVAGRFREQRRSIQKRLAEAEVKQREAEERLKAVQERLSSLDGETARIAEQARRDAETDAQRLRSEAERQAGLVLGRARRELELRVEAAKRELRRYAAERIAETAAREARARLDERMQGMAFERALRSFEEKAP
jgi:F-type H+-transporting ATPase subunit b